jgi:hypothetical protein
MTTPCIAEAQILPLPRDRSLITQSFAKLILRDPIKLGWWMAFMADGNKLLQPAFEGDQ